MAHRQLRPAPGELSKDNVTLDRQRQLLDLRWQLAKGKITQADYDRAIGLIT